MDERKCVKCEKFYSCRKKYKNKVCKKYKEYCPVPPSPNAHLYAQTQTPTYTPPPMPEVKPPKQRTVLSVRDFAILLRIAETHIEEMERNVQCVYMFEPKDREQKIKENMKDLQSNPYYQDLLRIREKLGELNVEIETPSVEVE